MKLKETAVAWTVRYTLPRTVTYQDGRQQIFAANHCSVVIAENVGHAIINLFSEFPEAKLVSVNPGPIGAVIVDDSLIGTSSD